MHAVDSDRAHAVVQLRKKLPPDRNGISRDFILSGHWIHVHTGEYEDGTLGEIFIEVAKAGSTMSGLLDNFATAVSLGLQYGVPLHVLAEKFTGTSFEPAGVVDGRYATSVLDLIFRFLMEHYA